MSAGQTTKHCALVLDPDPELPNRLKAVESVMVSLVSHLPTPQSNKGKRPLSAEICSCSANVKFYFWDDVIERERKVKQVQISWRLCVVHCHVFGLLVMVAVVFSSEKVNNNSYENKKISWFH